MSEQQEYRRHNHVKTLKPERICCINHLIEITTYFKQQGRSVDVQNLLVVYLHALNQDERLTNTETENDEQQDILKLYEIDHATAQELFLICNDFASRLTVQAHFEPAQVLIEQALVLSKYMPVKLQSCLESNISCFYERKNDMRSAKIYYEHAIELWGQAQSEAGEDGLDSDQASGEAVLEEELSDAINQAINHNNLSVIQLRQKSYGEAHQAARNAVNCIEGKLMEQMNRVASV